ncbi:MAG: O-antigen ligase family protein [SAR202 cluster bacterium]|nr:O-antigen ligase family protein [SAR202 cluster bacterium]
MAKSPIENVLLNTIRVLLVMALLSPLIVMTEPFPSTFFPFIVGKALYYRALIEIAVGIWLVLVLRDRTYMPPKSWLLPILGGYVFIALLASLLGVSMQRSLWSTYERMQGWVDLAHWYLYVVVAASVFRTWLPWRIALNFNLGVSIVMGLLGLTQYFDFGILPFLRTTQRLEISLGNPTYVGGYMAVNVLIALGFLASSFFKDRVVQEPEATTAGRRKRASGPARKKPESAPLLNENVMRAFWISALLMDLLMLYLSGTRGAFLGLVAGLLFFIAGYAALGRVRGLKLAAYGALGFVGALALLLVVIRVSAGSGGIDGTTGVLERVATTGLNDESMQGRIRSAKVGLQGFAERPILGWGPENFTIAYDRLVPLEVVAAATVTFDQAHNKLIEELTTKGILGLLGYMAFWGYLVFIVVRRTRSLESGAQALVLFAGAALVAYFVQNLFLFDNVGTVAQFYLLVAFVAFVDGLFAPREEPEGAAAPVRKGAAADIPLRGLKFLQTDGGLMTGAGIMAVLIFVAFTFYTLRPLVASQTVIKPLGSSRPWPERLALFEESIHTFPELGNYPRRVMLERMRVEWESMSQTDARAALDLAEKEGRLGIEAEPQEWRLHNSLAGLYQVASLFDPTVIPKSRVLVEEAAALAPTRIEVQLLLIGQFVVEGNFASARDIIDKYVAETPAAERHFRGIREQIDEIEAESAKTPAPG